MTMKKLSFRRARKPDEFAEYHIQTRSKSVAPLLSSSRFGESKQREMPVKIRERSRGRRRSPAISDLADVSAGVKVRKGVRRKAQEPEIPVDLINRGRSKSLARLSSQPAYSKTKQRERPANSKFRGRSKGRARSPSTLRIERVASVKRKVGKRASRGSYEREKIKSKPRTRSKSIARSASSPVYDEGKQARVNCEYPGRSKSIAPSTSSRGYEEGKEARANANCGRRGRSKSIAPFASSRACDEGKHAKAHRECRVRGQNSSSRLLDIDKGASVDIKTGKRSRNKGPEPARPRYYLRERSKSVAPSISTPVRGEAKRRKASSNRKVRGRRRGRSVSSSAFELEEGIEAIEKMKSSCRKTREQEPRVRIQRRCKSVAPPPPASVCSIPKNREEPVATEAYGRSHDLPASTSDIDLDVAGLDQPPCTPEELEEEHKMRVDPTRLSPPIYDSYPFFHPSSSKSGRCRIAGVPVDEAECRKFWGVIDGPGSKHHLSLSNEACRERLLENGSLVEKKLPLKRCDTWNPAKCLSDEKTRLEGGRKCESRAPKQSHSACMQHQASENLAESEDADDENRLRVVMSQFCFEARRYGNFPEAALAEKYLFMCDNCFRRFLLKPVFDDHEPYCEYYQAPPGTIVYKQEEIEIYQIEGDLYATFCRNLCLLAKMIIECKTAEDRLHSFFFYLLVKRPKKCRKAWYPIGYFSRPRGDKYIGSAPPVNLSCVLVLPPLTSKGYGRLLIDFSYCISRLRNLPGTPERPFSYGGVTAYRTYWADVICGYIEKEDGELDLSEMERRTGVLKKDLVQTMIFLGVFRKRDDVVVIAKSKQYLDRCKKREKAIQEGRYKEVKEDCVISNDAMVSVKSRRQTARKPKRGRKPKSRSKSKSKGRPKSRAKARSKNKRKVRKVSTRSPKRCAASVDTMSQYTETGYPMKTRSCGKAKENAQSATYKKRQVVEELSVRDAHGGRGKRRRPLQARDHIKASANGPTRPCAKGKGSRIANPKGEHAEEHRTRRVLGPAKSPCKVHISFSPDAFEKKLLGKRKHTHSRNAYGTTNASEPATPHSKRGRFGSKPYVCGVGNPNVGLRLRDDKTEGRRVKAHGKTTSCRYGRKGK